MMLKLERRGNRCFFLLEALVVESNERGLGFYARRGRVKRPKI